MDYGAKACGKCNKLNFAYDDKFHYEKRLFCSNSSSRKCTTSTGAMHIFRLISISKSNTNNSISDTYEIANFEHWTLFVDAPENQRIAALFGNPHFSIELISYIEHIVHQDLSPKGLLSIPFAYQCYSYSYSISHFPRHLFPLKLHFFVRVCRKSRFEYCFMNPFWLSSVVYSQQRFWIAWIQYINWISSTSEKKPRPNSKSYLNVPFKMLPAGNEFIWIHFKNRTFHSGAFVYICHCLFSDRLKISRVWKWQLRAANHTNEFDDDDLLCTRKWNNHKKMVLNFHLATVSSVNEYLSYCNWILLD